MSDDAKFAKKRRDSIKDQIESKIPDVNNKFYPIKSNVERNKMRKKKLSEIEGGLGVGTYGLVYKKGNYAIKQYEKLNHIIQEWIALKYLSDCTNVVRAVSADFFKKEISLKLYDCSVSDWLKNNKDASITQRLKIIKGALRGLVEIHTRGLTHGDIKPSNMLMTINNNTFETVIADCGFLSINKYSKVEYTSPIYQEPLPNEELIHGPEHDMFSFGLCCIEILTGHTVYPRDNDKKLDWNYDSIMKFSHNIMMGYPQWKSIQKMLISNENYRITSEDALYELFNNTIDDWSWNNNIIISKSDSSSDDNNSYRNDKICSVFKNNNSTVGRSRIGFIALRKYFENNGYLSPKQERKYIEATLYILYCMFKGQRPDLFESPEMLSIFTLLLNDCKFISYLMKPSN